LKKENERLKKELEETKTKLDGYLMKSKKYYETHKEEQKQRVKEYNEKTNYNANIPAEKKKQYARTAYLNQKAKRQEKLSQGENI
jgi:hypothetical protein